MALSALRRQPLTVQLTAVLTLGTVVGLGCGLLATNPVCAVPDSSVCTFAFLVSLAFTVASFLVLPELAVVAILVGVVHLVRLSQWNGPTVVSILVAASILAYFGWLDLPFIFR